MHGWAVVAVVFTLVTGFIGIERAIHDNTAAVNRVRAEVCRGAR